MAKRKGFQKKAALNQRLHFQENTHTGATK